ncbi:MAG: arsenate reductase (glutaredoxin) [Gammaproteobacteria bacterium]|nr:arsenate reductase (glutaredoxin) [Gammaproteobacteria bacterium]MBL6998770.1 arsenate reductase (glutaredoxin) [Gammaproteobacteria bacterium]
MTESIVTIYHNPRCSKSRQTLQLLEDNNISPTIIEYMNEPPDRQTLIKITQLLGVSIRALLRTTEQVYKDAGLDDDSLSDEDLLEALSQCPSLLQRPIVIVDNKKAAIGRPPESILGIL